VLTKKEKAVKALTTAFDVAWALSGILLGLAINYVFVNINIWIMPMIVFGYIHFGFFCSTFFSLWILEEEFDFIVFAVVSLLAAASKGFVLWTILVIAFDFLNLIYGFVTGEWLPSLTSMLIPNAILVTIWSLILLSKTKRKFKQPG